MAASLWLVLLAMSAGISSPSTSPWREEGGLARKETEQACWRILLRHVMCTNRHTMVLDDEVLALRVRGGASGDLTGKREREGGQEDKSTTKKAKSSGSFFFMHRKPPHYGSKPIPTGDPCCLQGMQFVISGVLDSLEREEAAHLIEVRKTIVLVLVPVLDFYPRLLVLLVLSHVICRQTHGGKVVSAVSRKVTHALIGEDAGETKMQKIREMGT
eukprot:757040-Hanusia_phi.AAC.5